MSDVILLESEAELVALEELGRLIATAQATNDEGLIGYIRSLWDGESFASILSKYNTENSTWYVWQMDGVRAMMAKDEEEIIEYPPYTCREDRQI